MRRLLTLSLAGTLLLVIPGTLVGKAHVPVGVGEAHVAVGVAKAHVPLGMVQVCRSGGKVKNVSENSLARLLGRSACRLTACAFNDVDDNDEVITQFIFLPGGDCDPTDADGDGFCDATGAPSDVPDDVNAIGVTPACTPAY